MKCKYCGEFYDSSLAHSHKCSPFERDELKRALDKASAPMTTPPLPSWPERLKFPLDTPYSQDIEAAYLHERNRADYWEARCRVAVEALQEARQAATWDMADEYIDVALAAICPLPPPVDDLPQQQRTGDV